MNHSTRKRRLFVHLFLICFTAATLLPIALVVKKAFTRGKNFELSINPIPEREEITLEHFKSVIGKSTSDGKWLFGRQLLNSIIISIGTTLFGVFFAATAAYAFSRFRFAGRKSGMMVFLVVQMFPATLLMIPLYIILSKLHLLNSVLGLILVYSTTAIPFCVWMLKGYFDTIPKELEEAALIDGASRLRIFYTIVLPLARPALAVTALFSFMTAWNEYILAATFLSREETYTLPVLLKSYVGEHGSADWGAFAAGAVLVSIPIVALFYVLQKHLVSGLTSGGVKG